MKGYKTSRNYERLRRLLDDGHEVVILAPPLNPYVKATAFLGYKEDKYYKLGTLTWATSYIEGAGWDFAPYCKEHGIEFIEPTEINP